MGITLVVLIDDLDRCLPETTISTLEAIRLLLFLKHTAFVIAADDQIIKMLSDSTIRGLMMTLSPTTSTNSFKYLSMYLLWGHRKFVLI
jgi:predicted KAP-like P-loop ATPase